MVKIAPFKGYVYNPDEIASHGGLLTSPPYDVLTQAQKDGYHRSHPHNFLHLDLGPVLPKDKDPLAWHTRSAKLLKEWLREKVLIRQKQPAIFLIDTDWIHPVSGRKQTRHGLMCLMRLVKPTKASDVRPHEKTFSYHKQERLALMEKTGAQLSPVFGFFPDQDSQILKTMFDYSRTDPDIFIAERSGLVHSVSFLQTPETVGHLVRAMAEKTVYIADGHHRYETALNYSEMVKSSLGGQVDEYSAINYVMVYLCPMSDPGLCILPTHRLLNHLDMSNEAVLEALSPLAEIKEYPFGPGGEKTARRVLSAKLAEDNKKGLSVFGLYLSGARSCYLLKVRERIKQSLVEASPESKELVALDVSILTQVIFLQGLGLSEEDMDRPELISYISSTTEAIRGVTSEQVRAAFLVNPTTVEEILKVTEEGLVMPRKATYFYPKVSNGLVVNLLDPSEIISAPLIR
ncbi:MAG: DUF1015 domain-containing protein [Deltaproteobacteria bacterium]|jgi:uncharacterized protein (DUF1015 family)|nr:DUF1015 domain-containing protein [Deltaproteobacteria bacterium]